MKLKVFFVTAKGLSLKQLKQISLEGVSPTLTYQNGPFHIDCLVLLPSFFAFYNFKDLL